MTTITKFEKASEDILNGEHDFGAHTVKVMLSNVAPDAAADTVIADITEISAGNGYTAGGVDISASVSRSGGTSTLVAADQIITASGGSIGPFRYMIAYNDTAANKPLIGFWDEGAEVTIQDGNSRTIDFSTDALLTLA